MSIVGLWDVWEKTQDSGQTLTFVINERSWGQMNAILNVNESCDITEAYRNNSTADACYD